MGTNLLNVAILALSWFGCNGMPVHILPVPEHHHALLDHRQHHHEDTQVLVHHHEDTQVLVKAPADKRQVHDRENHVLERMKKLEEHLKKTAHARANAPSVGHLLVNDPLPADFGERFEQAVSQATGADAKAVHLMSRQSVRDEPGVTELSFSAPSDVVKLVEDQAAEPTSKLTSGTLHSFLIAKEDEQGKDQEAHAEHAKAPEAHRRSSKPEPTPVMEKGIDVDTALPYGDLEPFGREDTAQELTENAVGESDTMVDQIERAEVAEEKRSVFRALTRLRGAAITSFDGVARSQTSNIDQYNKVHKWRKAHPMHHLADEESDITKWAFPSQADLVQTNSTMRKKAAVAK